MAPPAPFSAVDLVDAVPASRYSWFKEHPQLQNAAAVLNAYCSGASPCGCCDKCQFIATRDAIMVSDIVGFAAPVWCSQLPPPFVALMLRLGDDYFQQKRCFVVVTASSSAIMAGEQLKNLISIKGGTVFAQLCYSRAPPTFPWNLPQKGKQWKWGYTEIEQFTNFGSSLKKAIADNSFTPVSQLSPTLWERFSARLFKPSMLPHIVGRVRVDTSMCTKCGLCTRVCPVSAITLPDSGTPSISRNCLGCSRCVALCPFKALRVPCAQGRQFHTSMPLPPPDVITRATQPADIVIPTGSDCPQNNWTTSEIHHNSVCAIKSWLGVIPISHVLPLLILLVVAFVLVKFVSR
ncbi:hypothetical protein Pelo_14788 [Pelomyxa schiedti]|nr:hypothetical protein Pelo_14788 [Pelomyxa schiedti]